MAIGPWLFRFQNASMPYQNWCPFPPNAIVQVKNLYGESRIDLVKNLWWGYADGLDSESMIWKARRLDQDKRHRRNFNNGKQN